MDEILKKKILIVGASAKEYALAKKFHRYENIDEIFVTPGNTYMNDICTCVDIREEKVQELLEYAVKNSVDMTIATSEIAIKNDIANVFNANEQMIFAPTAQSANIALSKSAGKKFLYKLHIPTPKFGIFDKQQLAMDYLKTSHMPVVIRTDETIEGSDRLACPTFPLAKLFIDDLYVKDENKVLIEDYAYGHDFTFYIVTDGYHAIPLTSVANYKFMMDGDGGLLTPGVGSYAPDYKVSTFMEKDIMKNIITNTLSSLERHGTPYLGILGVECVVKEDGKVQALEFKTFLQDHDCQSVLNLIEENLYTLFEACAIGSFADDYHQIEMSDSSSISCMLFAQNSGKCVKGIELIDEADDIIPIGLKKSADCEYETIKGKSILITKTAKTLARAKKNMYEDIDLIEYQGKKYRKDICHNKADAQIKKY